MFLRISSFTILLSSCGYLTEPAPTIESCETGIHVSCSIPGEILIEDETLPFVSFVLNFVTDRDPDFNGSIDECHERRPQLDATNDSPLEKVSCNFESLSTTVHQVENGLVTCELDSNKFTYDVDSNSFKLEAEDGFAAEYSCVTNSYGTEYITN